MAKMGMSDDFENRLAALIDRLFGPEAGPEQVRRLSGGASQETWLLAGRGVDAILRRAPGGVSAARSSAAIGLAAEAALIAAAEKEAGGVESPWRSGDVARFVLPPSWGAVHCFPRDKKV